jgi:tetratricopeptide (TPR) repeat protein
LQLYRQAAAAEPRNADILHLMGVVLARLGKLDEAIPSLSGAVSLQPSNAAMQANLANALASANRPQDALAAYQKALALAPDFSAAHRGQGAVLLRLGLLEAAVAAFELAARYAPRDARLHCDLGVALERVGRADEAIQSFERAIELDPKLAQAHHNLALIEATRGRPERALAGIEAALKLQPQHPAAHANRGNFLHALGRDAEALESYDRSLSLNPNDPAVHYQRAMILMSFGRAADALGSFDRALALGPPEFEVHYHRGLALAMLEQYPASLASFDQALALKPNSAEALNSRGVALGRLHRSEDALESFTRAVALKPDYVEGYTNAGNVLIGLERIPEALVQFDRALTLRPEDADAAWSKGLLKLTLGEFSEGWKLYEARLRLNYLRHLQRHVDLPRWEGQSLQGRTLLVHAEQGLGDSLQFCRYVPMLEPHGARIIFEVQPVLKPLMHSLGFRGELLARGEPLPAVDYRVPLLSVPLALQATLEDIPASMPYLRADPASVDAWSHRLAALSGLKVGLYWQGNPETEKQPWLHGRSFALAEAEALARVGGVTLVSLQKGVGAEQRSQVSFADRLVELMDPLDLGAEALGRMAAIMTRLDLIVTSDTLCAHLAGALGLPVWVVLSRVADWRWLTLRGDSPWYPTMRLFRQERRGDWRGVFDRIAGELETLATRRDSSS